MYGSERRRQSAGTVFVIVFERCYDSRIIDLHSDEVWPVSGQNMYNVTPATLLTAKLCTYR